MGSFNITYHSTTLGKSITRPFEGADEKDAQIKFLAAWPGIRTEQIQTVERAAPQQKPLQIVWRDKRTGEEFIARQDYIEKLPTVLRQGKASVMLVKDVLLAMGFKDSEANRRQLRFAKAYLVAEKDIPICSVRSLDGGYFLATDASDLFGDADAYRAQAEGMIRAAEELEALAHRIFSKEVAYETTLQN